MELMNQVLFGIFTLILFGVYLTSAKGFEVSGESTQISPYWRYSIVLRALAFLFWVLVPVVGQVVLPLANFAYDAAVILLAVFIRSWRKPPGKRLLQVLVVYYLCTCSIYMYFYFTVESFVPRITVIGISTLIMMFWEVFEVWRFWQAKKGALLGIVVFFIFIQLLISIASLAYVRNPNITPVQNILQADLGSSVMLWIVFGIHVLIYVLINSYLYQNLWASERSAREKYDKVSVEREKIRALLLERESLISSLLKSNKTAATGALAASLAHELSQPLGASLLNAQSLKSLLDKDNLEPGLEKKIVGSIEADTKRAAQIIRSLRSLFSGDTVSFETVSLTELVHSVAQLVSPECKTSKIELQIEVPKGCDILANKIEIQQVILNLVNNAIQSLSDTTGPNQKVIKVIASQVNGTVTLKVIDNGPGVAYDKQSALFDLLDTQKSSGMGLGLWLCKHIMQRHAGDISYAHSEEPGATFTLVFPPPGLLS